MISINYEAINNIHQIYGRQLAKEALKLEATKLSPDSPFTWASGYKMPIYNDNRRFLAKPELRLLIAKAFSELLTAISFDPDWLAGTATAGIPHSVTLGDLLKKPVSYVHSGGKDHGLKNQIEGLASNANYSGASVLVIEDLISTGESSIKAIEAVSAANGVVPTCFAIFSYGFKRAEEAFATMNPKCTSITILNYDITLEEAVYQNYITEENKKSLSEWKLDPFGW